MERRQFALSEATDQIVASLRPVLKRGADRPIGRRGEGLVIDGYPGSYGQILTNLFLNAANHAFADGRSGAISQFGGPMMLDSRLGQGTIFRIIMPRAAKGGSGTADAASDGTPRWPNRTMSST
jgi:signal transduction histidine kinase